MADNFEFLAEKDAVWAGMLEQVLKDNHIPVVSVPVFGAGITLKSGKLERYQIYVPHETLPLAKELLEELFSGDAILSDSRDLEAEP